MSDAKTDQEYEGEIERLLDEHRAATLDRAIANDLAKSECDRADRAEARLRDVVDAHDRVLAARGDQHAYEVAYAEFAEAIGEAAELLGK